MKIRNKIISGITSMALVASVFTGTAFAATDTYENGDYTATVHMYKSTDATALSMCDPIFDHDAEVTLTDDATVITIYVAYPIPAYSDYGTDGTLLDVTATYNDVTYTADLDTTSLTERELDETSALFGTTAGESYPTEVITFTLPADAIDTAVDTDSGIYVSAYVNSVMNSTQYFYMRLSDMVLTAAEESTEETTEDTSDATTTDATETSSQSATVTGTVEKNVATYTVTVPASVALGTLSKETDTSVAYDVTVEAENFDGESVEVVADATGELVNDSSAEDTIAFANDFGTQTTTASATLSGNINVSATDVAAAKSGNYTGTTSFTINYYAAEDTATE